MPMDNAGQLIVSRLEAVRAGIVRAARDVGRDPADITLVAVTKTFDRDAIARAIAAGQRVFGENRVQEAKAKCRRFGQSTPIAHWSSI
ncbi:MAG: hypothetical protein JO163_20930 [Methylobacteriaceae bacterium]|nr:hypothetical protein [Methylobacteriaceae bacterium]